MFVRDSIDWFFSNISSIIRAKSVENDEVIKNDRKNAMQKRDFLKFAISWKTRKKKKWFAGFGFSDPKFTEKGMFQRGALNWGPFCRVVLPDHLVLFFLQKNWIMNCNVIFNLYLES